MASIAPPPPSHKLSFTTHKLQAKRLLYPSRFYSTPRFSFSNSTLCRCSNSNRNPSDNNNNNNNNNNLSLRWRWDSVFQDAIRNTMKRLDSYINSPKKKNNGNDAAVMEAKVEKEEEEWNWERWRRQFEEVDEQERLLSVLKSQLGHAVVREDYEDAARLKVAIAAAATNDTVGTVMSHLNRAIAEERYRDAAFLRDNAGAGLVGWWSGISEDLHDPYGVIINITAEHGRYVARSYNPRQLATAALGIPLFEIFLTKNKKGEYKQQAVYLKRKGVFQDPSTFASKASGASSHLSPPGPTADESGLFVVSTEDNEDGDDIEDGFDLAQELTSFKNILRDMIPGVKVKVLKVTAPTKVDRDFITKVVEQAFDDEDEEKDIESENEEEEDEISSGSDQESEEIEMGATPEIIDDDDRNEIAVKVVIGSLAQKLSGSVPAKDSLRVPAKLEKKDRSTFAFSIEKGANRQDSGTKEPASDDRKAKLQGQRSVEHVMFDLAKLIGREKIPLKVLKDFGELINFSLNQARNPLSLSGSTTFHRMEISASSDPLNGLYIGAHGLYTSDVIHLQRRFGQWQDERGTKRSSNLEFYEYVEAVKLTGDPYVPAGQVAFRAKVGKRHQLPHKGIIPEEFGVIARYKGQGRLAEPGFRNPQWVDGELVILDGKYIKAGPVVGFVYWAPEYHFLVFFNRLRLQ